MSEPAHFRELNGLVAPAFREAGALGFNWVGPEDFVLAILALADGSPARVALERVGITHAVFAEAYAAWIDGAEEPVDRDDGRDMTMNPAAHQLLGRADGIAIGIGADATTAEHVLMAFVWADSGTLEWAFDVKREAVLESLRGLGVDVPSGPLPRPPRAPGARIFVPYDEIMAVVNRLIERLPRGSGVGFNHDGKSRAWVSAYPEVDLQRHVNDVLAELGLEPVPQPGGS